MSCGRKLGPYDCCSVVCGDCLELMKALPDGCVDAVITDPPYGVNNDCDYSRFTLGPNTVGTLSVRVYPPVFGDDKPFDPSPWMDFPKVVLWGFNYFAARLPVGTVLVWLKRFDDGFESFMSDAEMAWMKGGKGIYCRRDCSLMGGNSKNRKHPTEKPEGIMRWCIEKAGVPGTILDPFLGSGTTAVAAKKLGRHFLGFEISEEYCRIARERIALVEAQPGLFEPKLQMTREMFDEINGKVLA